MATAAAQSPSAAAAAVGTAVVFSCEDDTAFRPAVRKPNRQARENKQYRSGKHEHLPITRTLRTAILDAAQELWAAGDCREYSAVIAKRLQLGRNGEHLVDEVLTGWALQHRSEAAALRVGMRSAEDMAREAAQGVWDDLGDAA